MKKTKHQKIQALPDASVGEILGLLDVLSMKNGACEASKLAQELLLEDAKLLAVLQASELLGLGSGADGEARITSLGEELLKLKVAGRKAALRPKMMEIPLISSLVDFVTREGGKTRKKETLQEISEILPGEDTLAQFRILLSWVRFTGILGYNDKQEEIYLGESS